MVGASGPRPKGRRALVRVRAPTHTSVRSPRYSAEGAPRPRRPAAAYRSRTSRPGRSRNLIHRGGITNTLVRAIGQRSRPIVLRGRHVTPHHGGRRAEREPEAARASGAQSIPDAAISSALRPRRLRSGEASSPSRKRERPVSGTRRRCRRTRRRRNGASARESIKGGARPPGGAPELTEPVNSLRHHPIAPHALFMVASASTPSRAA
jgi:hypothetical protein